MSANTETTGAPDGYVPCSKSCGRYAHVEPAKSPIRPGSGLCCAKGYLGIGHNDWCHPTDAPPEPAKPCTCPHGPHTTDGKCPVHVTAGIPVSGFVDCACAKCSMCDLCYLDLETALGKMMRGESTGKPYDGPARIDRRLARDEGLESDCLGDVR